MQSEERAPMPERNTLLPQPQTKNTLELKPSPSSILCSKRFGVCLLLFIGHTMISMGSQVVNIAVIEMTSKLPQNLSTNSDVESTNHESSSKSPKFQWDAITVGNILNMFWYGCFFTPIGGILAQKFGGATTMGVTMMLTSVAILLTPTSLYIHFYLFLAFRGLTGLLEGFSCTSCTPIFAHWIPKHERPTLVSLIVNGFYLGNALTFILCGFIAHHWGWSMSFYIAGIICFAWSLSWLLFVTNTPAEDKRISKTELAYIKQGTGNVSAKTNNSHPYKEILLSPPFWALTVCKFAYGWSTAFVVGYCPAYIRDITRKNVNTVGYLSSIPNLANFLLIPIGGVLLSWVQKRTKLQDNEIHKIILCTGFVICAALFILITLTNNFIISMICIVSINVVVSYNRVLYELITVNMAPNHSSLISGMSLFGQPGGTIIAQIFIGFMVQNHNGNEWNVCFLWTTGILVFIAVMYFFFGSSQPQPWSLCYPSQNETGKMNK